MLKADVDQKPVTRTSAGLRDALFDAIDGIRAGRLDASKANATARLAAEIVNTARLEIEARKGDRCAATSSHTLPTIQPLQLGS